LRRCPIIVVTNQELLPAIRAQGYRGEIVCCPLAVESKVLSMCPGKTFSLVQAGRQNPKLHEWGLKLAEVRPALEYMYVDSSSGKPYWKSTKRGDLPVGLDRDSFLEQLGSAHIALVSAPGIDGGEKRTGGFNPVTPRFYEAAGLGCQMVGRYPRDGVDFLANDVSSVCPHVETYKEFCTAVDAAFAVQGPDQKLRNFAEVHSGHALARRIREQLQPHGISFPK
jgi:hypothetical protein